MLVVLLLLLTYHNLGGGRYNQNILVVWADILGNLLYVKMCINMAPSKVVNNIDIVTLHSLNCMPIEKKCACLQLPHDNILSFQRLKKMPPQFPEHATTRYFDREP